MSSSRIGERDGPIYRVDVTLFPRIRGDGPYGPGERSAMRDR